MYRFAVFFDAFDDAFEVVLFDFVDEDVVEVLLFGEAVRAAGALDEEEVAQALDLAADVGGRDADHGESHAFALEGGFIFNVFAREGVVGVEDDAEHVDDDVAGVAGVEESDGEAEFLDEVAPFEVEGFFVFSERDFCDGQVTADRSHD